MKSSTKILLALGLVTLLAAAILYPEHWVMPGGVAPGHAELKSDCFACHVLFRGTPTARCLDCHDPRRSNNVALADLHRGVTDQSCLSCHAEHPTPWRAASFDHKKYFLLEGDHQAPCSTCHTQRNFSRYTCYGCHEHNPTRIAREHREEGITRFGDCVQCHRSGAEAEREDDD